MSTRRRHRLTIYRSDLVDALTASLSADSSAIAPLPEPSRANSDRLPAPSVLRNGALPRVASSLSTMPHRDFTLCALCVSA